MNLKFNLELILNTKVASISDIQNSLAELGHALDVQPMLAQNNEEFKININTDDPTLIFDACAQLGKLKNVKIVEVK